VPPAAVEGCCDPRFAPVRDAFRGNSGERGEVGAAGFCDPESGVAFGYVMNQMGPRWQNPRTRALVDAVYECL
jgi:hypothetical protein